MVLKRIKSISGATKTNFPLVIEPMLATLTENPPVGNGWTYEIKWDGYRSLAFCNMKKVNLISRNNKSFNDKFYPLVTALQQANLNAVLDGEIVVLTSKGISNFNNLQNWRSEADGELIYYVFDILWVDGYDLTKASLTDRRQLLKQVVTSATSIRISESFDISVSEFLKAAKESGLEGIMAKRSDSLYYPGLRVKNWLKIKIQKRHEVVIGGYTKNDNSPKYFSSLLVGVFENGVLQYTGKIGTGFTDKMQKEMMANFKSLIATTCPFSFTPDVNKPSRFRTKPPHAEVIWLLPRLVCEVSYTEMTVDGVMRHPSFGGMREDKNAEEVHKEVPLKIVPTQLKQITPVNSGDRKTLLNPSEESQTKKIKGHELKFSNLSKVFWPDEGITKRDLINYYYQAAPFILPYLKNRPQSLNRFPNGIKGKSFYQKDVSKSAPEWVQKFPYHTSDGEDKNFIVVKDEADLLWMANLAAIEMNPWNSTIQTPDNPDWCIIDIDPTSLNTFDQVVDVAKETHKVLEALKIEGYCKTSGATGLHVYIPMGALYTYEQCQCLLG